MEIMAKLNKDNIDRIVELIDYNNSFGITTSQLDLARQYKIEVDDILKCAIHAERIFYGFNHYEISYKTNKGYTYNIIIVIE